MNFRLGGFSSSNNLYTIHQYTYRGWLLTTLGIINTSAPNTKREVKAEVVMTGRKTVKRLANAAFLSRGAKVTTDHGTQTVREGRSTAGWVETKMANPDGQTTCLWNMDGPPNKEQETSSRKRRQQRERKRTDKQSQQHTKKKHRERA